MRVWKEEKPHPKGPCCHVSFLLKEHAFKHRLIFAQRMSPIPDACLDHTIDSKNMPMSNPAPPPAWVQLKPNSNLPCSASPSPNSAGIFL